MMNTNSSGNQSPSEETHQNKPIQDDEPLDEKIKGRSIEVRPNDVLCGRSKASFNHGQLVSDGLLMVLILTVVIRLRSHIF